MDEAMRGDFAHNSLWIHIAWAPHALVDLQYSKRPWSDHILSMNYFCINNKIKSMQNNESARVAVQMESAAWLFKATDYCWHSFYMPTICSISLQTLEDEDWARPKRANLCEYETCLMLKYKWWLASKNLVVHILLLLFGGPKPPRLLWPDALEKKINIRNYHIN